MYEQAPENTLDSLAHGINHFDGIEFDIRITKDGQLVLHHDRGVSLPPHLLEGRPKYVEGWTLEELQEVGFSSLQDVLDDSRIISQWRDNGKIACVEIKRPHPKGPLGGGYLGSGKHIDLVAKIIRQADEMFNEAEIPDENLIYYAFHKGMTQSVKKAQTERRWAALIPYVIPFGGRRLQRMHSFPQYLSTPFSRLVKKHRKAGSSMLPCAAEYFSPPVNKLPIGTTVGLQGKQRKALDKIRAGMTTYVWPVKPVDEFSIQNAGLTGLSDYADPNLTWLPSGHTRWQNPGSMPLDSKQTELLYSATEENHLDILKQLQSEVTPWSECDETRRKELVDYWRKRWSWRHSSEHYLNTASETSPVWNAVRMIGHRGAGKSPHPVLNPSK